MMCQLAAAGLFYSYRRRSRACPVANHGHLQPPRSVATPSGWLPLRNGLGAYHEPHAAGNRTRDRSQQTAPLDPRTKGKTPQPI
jgi:hypothetical protein